MDKDETTGRTPVLAQMLEAWRQSGDPPTWDVLSRQLGGLAENIYLIRWPGGAISPVIEQAGAQAVLAYGMALAGAPVEALTPGRRDAAREAAEALKAGRPLTVEDAVGDGLGGRRIARLYLPLNETPPALACGVVRID